MAARATFTYNGTDTITAHITGATPGHTITVYVQDDNWASNESIVAPSASFDFVYPGSVGCSPPAPRFVFAWDEQDSNAIIGVTVFGIDSASPDEYELPLAWHYDGASTVTVKIKRPVSTDVGLDTSIGNFDEFHSTHSVSAGSLMTVTLATATHTQRFFANVYRYTGGTYEVWGTRVFTPGVAGGGEAGNPNGETVTWDYDGVIGGGVAVAHIANAIDGAEYRFNVSDNASSAVNATATGATLDITVNTIGGNPAGTVVSTRVWRTGDGCEVGVSVIEMGTAGEYSYSPRTWDYDGANTVTVEFLTENGKSYVLTILDNSGASSGSSPTVVGDGSIKTATAVAPGDFYDGFVGRLDDIGGDDQPTDRLFRQGFAGGGSPGNPNPVLTEATTDIGKTSATFHALVNPEGVASTVSFEYGLTNSYGETTPAQSIGSGTSPVPISEAVTGLRLGRTYHVRAVRSP